MQTTFPSAALAHRRADFLVHAIGITAIIFAAHYLLRYAPDPLWPIWVYVLCALASNLASQAYHFSPWHGQRPVLRRIDHAAIYLSICGTFTPLLVKADTTLALTILILSWILAAFGIWSKLFSAQVKARWSTLSYLGLGALSLSALPDVAAYAANAVWLILAGSAAYAVGTIFYARKSMPYRYAIWHTFVTLGGILMFVGVWYAVVGT